MTDSSELDVYAEAGSSLSVSLPLALAICTKCGETKPVVEFRTQLSRSGNPYRHGSCNCCQARAATQWAKDHRAHCAKRVLLAYHEKKKHDQRFMESKRRRARETAGRYRAKPGVPELQRKQAKVHRQNNIVKYLIRSAKARAAKKGLVFGLTIEWALMQWTGKCALTGIEFDWCRGRGSLWSPSIDRIVPSLGYSQSNCRFILQAVNQFKGSGSDDEMIRIATALVSGRPS